MLVQVVVCVGWVESLRAALSLIMLSEQSDCQTFLSSSSSSTNSVNVILNRERECAIDDFEVSTFPLTIADHVHVCAAAKMHLMEQSPDTASSAVPPCQPLLPVVSSQDGIKLLQESEGS